jgi:hypothetical protein
VAGKPDPLERALPELRRLLLRSLGVEPPYLTGEVVRDPA